VAALRRIYHVSGQAAADKRARDEQLATRREQEAQAERQRREAQANREREEAALANLDAAWQDYLVASRTKFKQVVIVKRIAANIVKLPDLLRMRSAMAPVTR
jgi:hypothetical protein